VINKHFPFARILFRYQRWEEFLLNMRLGSIESTQDADEARRLTSFSHGGGCGCKVDPAELKVLLQQVPAHASHPKNMLVGVEHGDDAAVYQINSEQALVFTNDFQTPLVDDPYIFGCAAAANALSDVYAMGGTPIMATAIAGFPVNEVKPDRLQQIMLGGTDICNRAGVPLAGGHTIDNPQPIYGLAVIGMVHPTKIKTNAASRVGDKVIITKPLGIGLLASAFRIDQLQDHHYQTFVESITDVNSAGSWLGDIAEVHALTDITGFGLAGHLVEMAEGARVRIQINADKVPLYAAAEQLARDGVFPGGAYRNMEAYDGRLSFGQDWNIDRQLIFTDPQTNGGLLITLAPEAVDSVLERLHDHGCPEATVIGEVFAEGTDWQKCVLFS
jgi:selenide,water dikinase